MALVCAGGSSSLSISINDDWDIGGKRVSQQRFQLAQALTSRMPRLRCQHAVEVVLYFETLIMIPPPLALLCD